MNFNEQQKEIINTVNGNMLVIASAGSGKTTVLTHRIKTLVDSGIPPESILAITFSKKAKDNIIVKLRNMSVNRVNIETFHSFALKVIKSAYGNDRYKVWDVKWEKEKFIQDICVSLKLCPKNDDAPYNEISSFISLQKVNMLKPSDDLIYPTYLPFENERMQKIYEDYENMKANNSYIEYDDFLNMANDIFDEKPYILRKYHSEIKYVLVDEFQDVSLAQSLMLNKLNDDNTMVVGDPLQAIYSFRGGSDRFILDFDQTYENAKVVNLNINYRCSSDIVATANKLASTTTYFRHRNYKNSIAYNNKFRQPELHHFTFNCEEINWIAQKISDLIDSGYRYKDIAVLARTNAQLQQCQTTFNEYNIPFEIIGSKNFIDLPEIQLVLSYIKLSVDENDNTSFRYLYNKPNRWLSSKFLKEVEEMAQSKNISLYSAMDYIARREWRFKNGIDEIYDVIRHIKNHMKKYSSVADAVKYLRKHLNIDKFVSKGNIADDGSYTEQTENLNSFEKICGNFKSFEQFLYFINNFGENNKKSIEDSVKLLTIHKSKGLEYPVVFIIGCNDGLLPHSKNIDSEDELKLFYVAITRAEKELYMSYSDIGIHENMEVSPFISSIREELKFYDETLKK